jgi:serine/threonine-protein kinase
VQGTPDYIAPEQVRRLQLDRRTDVFNLGATMYWVLTSEKYPTALQGTDPKAGHRLVTADKVLAPIELNDKIPLSLSNLVMECCRENPAERPSDMKQVASRLAAIQNLWNKQLEQLRSQPRAKDEAPAEQKAEPLASKEANRAAGGLRVNEQSVRFLEEEE